MISNSSCSKMPVGGLRCDFRMRITVLRPNLRVTVSSNKDPGEALCDGPAELGSVKRDVVHCIV
jgi:hypothetical protein